MQAICAANVSSRPKDPGGFVLLLIVVARLVKNSFETPLEAGFWPQKLFDRDMRFKTVYGRTGKRDGGYYFYPSLPFYTIHSPELLIVDNGSFSIDRTITTKTADF